MNNWELASLEKEVFDEVLEAKIKKAKRGRYVKPPELAIQLGGLPIPPKIHESSRSETEASLFEMWQNPAVRKIAKSIVKPKRDRNRLENYII